MRDSPHGVKAKSCLAALLPVVLALVLGPARARAADAPGGANDTETPVLSLPTPVGPVTYTPGRGLRVGDTGLTLGGYSNLNLVRDEGGPATLTLDDVSLFVSWNPTARFHLFSELEWEDLIELDDHGRSTSGGATFTAERLYGDFTLLDALNLRLGKFLTPVGRWNVIHAQPLVWTTSRPLATLLPFDPHTTGAMLFGAFDRRAGTLSYEVYGQCVDQFQPTIEPQLAHRSAGGRLEYGSSGGWSVGASYTSFSHDGTWSHLGGLDGLWQHGPFELMGEAVREQGGNETQWGFYLQGVAEVWRGLFLVGRYEHYAQAAGLPVVNIGVAGLNWRPLPYLALKVEYLFADHRAEESAPGFKSSVAILF